MSIMFRLNDKITDNRKKVHIGSHIPPCNSSNLFLLFFCEYILDAVPFFFFFYRLFATLIINPQKKLHKYFYSH